MGISAQAVDRSTVYGLWPALSGSVATGVRCQVRFANVDAYP